MSRHQSLLTCLIFIFLANRLCFEAYRSGASNQPRITNGTEVAEGRWPFIAALFYEKEEANFCGGSVLNDDTILTAAHCLMSDEGIGSPTKVTVYLGHVNLNGTKDEKYLFKAKQFFVHKKYKYGQLAAGHDLAVIKLARKIDFRALKNVAKVCLPESDDPQTDKCVVMGWGDTETGSIPTKLLQADLSILSKEQCSKHDPTHDKEIVFCASNTKEGKDSCHGDSGGPLVCLPKASEEDKQPVYLQYGIVSYGPDACATEPGFYTRAAVFLDWIRQKAEA